jgi:hypothetical protein
MDYETFGLHIFIGLSVSRLLHGGIHACTNHNLCSTRRTYRRDNYPHTSTTPGSHTFTCPGHASADGDGDTAPPAP